MALFLAVVRPGQGFQYLYMKVVCQVALYSEALQTNVSALSHSVYTLPAVPSVNANE